MNDGLGSTVAAVGLATGLTSAVGSPNGFVRRTKEPNTASQIDHRMYPITTMPAAWSNPARSRVLENGVYQQWTSAVVHC